MRRAYPSRTPAYDVEKGGESMLSEGKKLALLGAAVLCLYLLCRGAKSDGGNTALTERAARPAAEETGPVRETFTTTLLHAPASSAGEKEESFFAPSQAEKAVATTITSGTMLRNETEYLIDADDVVREGTTIRLPADGPQILIIHTHSSEA